MTMIADLQLFVIKAYVADVQATRKEYKEVWEEREILLDSQDKEGRDEATQTAINKISEKVVELNTRLDQEECALLDYVINLFPVDTVRERTA